MDAETIRKLKRIVRNYYRTHGRHELPWRKTKDPYKILVSEIMLQQTQVIRVVPKYTAFIKRFPTVKVLAESPLKEVLVLWSGLGYNRRAKLLHEAAKQVVALHGGKIPRSFEMMCTLRGVGPYTAGAVCVFAYNMPIPLIETNIRTVFFHHVFQGDTKISDKILMEYSEKCIDKKDPRTWFWALMDYGSYLKAKGVRTNKRSTHYTKQSTFKGSDREVRGAIVKVLTGVAFAQEKEIQTKTKLPFTKIRTQLLKLKREGIVQDHGGTWSL
jgi:A/G-specific adenine glycosylase